MSRSTASRLAVSIATAECWNRKPGTAVFRLWLTFLGGSLTDFHLGHSRNVQGGKVAPMRRLVVVTFLLIVVAACAPKPAVVPVPVVSTPKYPDFVAPTIPTAFVGSTSADLQDRGWKFLQAGDLRNAEREFDLALRLTGTFYPAETSLGYLALARADANAALGHFNRTLDMHKGDLSALVGQGQALLALNREADALSSFEAALTVDPSAGDV